MRWLKDILQSVDGDRGLGRILLIDDDKDFNAMMKALLFEEGFTNVISTTSGEEGVKLAQKHKPDLIFVDWQMPHFSGLNVLLELKRSKNTIRIPTCILTGKKDVRTFEVACAAGATDFLTKPATPVKLVNCIRKHLSGVA